MKEVEKKQILAAGEYYGLLRFLTNKHEEQHNLQIDHGNTQNKHEEQHNLQIDCGNIKIKHKKLYKLQINYYFDTEDFELYRKGGTLRVRQIEQTLKIQYKYNKKIVGNTRICDEYSAQTDTLPRALKNPVTKDNKVYKPVGVMVTDRYNFFIEDMTVSLDKNYYLGFIDYELEIETDNLPDNKTEFLGIDFSGSTDGKYQRFIKRLRGLK